MYMKNAHVSDGESFDSLISQPRLWLRTYLFYKILQKRRENDFTSFNTLCFITDYIHTKKRIQKEFPFQFKPIRTTNKKVCTTDNFHSTIQK